MGRTGRKIPFGFVKLINVILVWIPFILVWFAHYEPKTMTATSRQVSALMLLSYACVFYYSGMSLDGFSVEIKRISQLIFSQIIAVGVTDVIAALMIWMLSVHFPNLVYGFACFMIQCVIIAFACLFSHRFFFRVYPPKKAVIIYDVRQGMERLIDAYGLSKRYEILASCPAEEVLGAAQEGCGSTMKQKLSQAESVFLCGLRTHDRNIILKFCVSHGIGAFIIPGIGDTLMSSAQRIHMFHLPFLKVNRYRPSTEFLLFKRVFDFTASGLSLILLSPLMLIVALAVKSDGGPAFYRQIRLTKDGKRFSILKFRSMRTDAEKYSGAVQCAGENDPRITRVGRFIRACRLDELPQLWNIFTGDMSFVGPRPERPELASEFEKDFPEFALRLQCKAGLTGYAQVYGKYNTTPYDKTLMDLMYIANPSILQDLTILLETLKTIFSKESTEGVGASTAGLKYEVRDKNTH